MADIIYILNKHPEMKNINISTLTNGLRVVCGKSDGNVAYIGVLTNAGSRDDFEGADGLAHFVEHTLFKGTPTKKSLTVSNRMELIGGELNAYTTKEEIMLYTNAPAGYEQRAIELLADLINNACFPANDLELERNVIKEEINSYHDNPSFAVFDEFDEFFYKGSSLAHNILGYENTVDKISSADCRDFISRWFAPENMVIYCVTPTPATRCLRLIEKYFGVIDRSFSGHTRLAPSPQPIFDITRHRDNHQANVVTGCEIFNSSDSRRFALYLYSNLLGGSAMNSRLNRELREKRGLVYTTESSISLYSDAGLFQVYYATDAANIDKCQKIVGREIDRLASARLSAKMLEQAKKQICGQLLVSGENRESCAMNLAKGLMRHGEIHDNRYTADRIMALTADEFYDIACFVAEAQFSRLVIS